VWVWEWVWVKARALVAQRLPQHQGGLAAQRIIFIVSITQAINTGD
jgi:hypothetical protein